MALPASDNFNRANANPLDGNWTNGTSSGMAIVSNAAAGGTASSNRAFWNGDLFANDHYSQCISPTISDGGPAVRCSTGNNYYGLYIQGSQLKIEKFVSGSATLLGSAYSYTPTTSEVFKLTAVGTTISVYANDVFLFSRTDSALASGAAGMHTYGTTTRLDNWEGGDVAGGGSVIPIFMNQYKQRWGK